MPKDMRSGFATASKKSKKEKAHDKPSAVVTEEAPHVARDESDGKVRVFGRPMMVPVAKINKNSFNYKSMAPFMLEKLKENIQREGFNDPITVREKKDGTYEIIDGEHRWLVAKELGMEEVPVMNLGRIKTNKAKALMISMNELHGKADPDDLAHVLADLSREDPDLLTLLPYDETEISALVSSVDDSLADLADVEGGEDVEADDGADINSGEGDDVADFLGLYEITVGEHSAYIRRLREEVIPTLKFQKRPAGLLEALIDFYVEQRKKSAKKS